MVRKAITALTTISTSNTTQHQHDHQHHAPPTTHHLSTRYPSLKEITTKEIQTLWSRSSERSLSAISKMWNWVNPASHVLVVGYQVTSSFTHNQTPISALVHACAVACLGFVVWVISNKAPSLWAQNDFAAILSNMTRLTFQGELKKVQFRIPEARAQTPWTGLMGKIRARSVFRGPGHSTIEFQGILMDIYGYSWIFSDIHHIKQCWIMFINNITTKIN